MMLSGLVFHQNPTFPVSSFEFLLAVVVCSLSFSDITFVVSFEPVSSRSPIILAMAIHLPFHKITSIKRPIRILHDSLTFNSVKGIFLFNFTVIDNTIMKLKLDIQCTFEELFFSFGAIRINKSYATLFALFIESHFMI